MVNSENQARQGADAPHVADVLLVLLRLCEGRQTVQRLMAARPELSSTPLGLLAIARHRGRFY